MALDDAIYIFWLYINMCSKCHVEIQFYGHTIHKYSNIHKPVKMWVKLTYRRENQTKETGLKDLRQTETGQNVAITGQKAVFVLKINPITTNCINMLNN